MEGTGTTTRHLKISQMLNLSSRTQSVLPLFVHWSVQVLNIKVKVRFGSKVIKRSKVTTVQSIKGIQCMSNSDGAINFLLLLFSEYILVCMHNEPHSTHSLHGWSVCILHLCWKCVVCIMPFYTWWNIWKLTVLNWLKNIQLSLISFLGVAAMGKKCAALDQDLNLKPPGLPVLMFYLYFQGHLIWKLLHSSLLTARHCQPFG